MRRYQDQKVVAGLPKDIQDQDQKWPESGNHMGYQEIRELGLDSEKFTFYKTNAFGWVLTTLHISKAKRAGSADRSYGVTMDGKLVRVGMGPHVLQELTVYLSKENLPRLQQYVDLWLKGMELAGVTRDRISTRRAQGQLHRAAGRTSWMW